MGRKEITGRAAVTVAGEVSAVVKGDIEICGPETTVYVLRYSTSTEESARRVERVLAGALQRADFSSLRSDAWAHLHEAAYGLG